MALTLEQQVRILLTPPRDVGVVSAHYAPLTAAVSPGLEVHLQADSCKGKGLFATRAHKQGDVLLREPPLAGVQHHDNRATCFSCCACFRFLGSVEEQLAWQLINTMPDDDEGDEDEDEGDEDDEDEDMEEGRKAGTGGKEEGEGGGKGVASGAEEDAGRGDKALPDAGGGLAVAMKRQELAVSLSSGAMKLPHSDSVKLPKPVPCRGGCADEVYCSEACAASAWETYHRLLCQGPPPADLMEEDELDDKNGGECDTGKGSATGVAAGVSGAAADGGGGGSCAGDSDENGSGGVCGGGGRAGNGSTGRGPRSRSEILAEFESHAHATNDTFRLVGRIYSQVLMSAERALEQQGAAGKGKAAGGREDEDCWRALMKGWEPFVHAHKAPWWTCLQAPEDVDKDRFQAELRQLALESLELLRAALWDERFAALFSPEVFGSLMGMFELNNLGLVVPNPLATYLDVIDCLPVGGGAGGGGGQAAAAAGSSGRDEKEQGGGERTHAQHELAPILDLLSGPVAEPAEGTAFYAVQSCANHSCAPSAAAYKGEDDVDGAAVLLAQRDIAVGEEVTISYIDESMTYADRQAALADYGFTCSCPVCERERPDGNGGGIGNGQGEA